MSLFAFKGQDFHDFLLCNMGQVDETQNTFVVEVADPESRAAVREALITLPRVKGAWNMGTCRCAHPGAKECPDQVCMFRRELHENWLLVTITGKRVQQAMRLARNIAGVTGLAERRRVLEAHHHAEEMAVVARNVEEAARNGERYVNGGFTKVKIAAKAV